MTKAKIDAQRLLGRLDAFAAIGATQGGGVNRQALSQEDRRARQLLTEAIQQLLEMLPAREADILRLRYGFCDGENHSMAQIGEIMGYSRERIRQLQHEALSKLRVLDREMRLVDYLD